MFAIRARLARRARAWARRRQGSDRLPLAIHRQRVYILPTRLGVIYALALLTMLLASMNYNNSLGFALTFLLASLGLVSMFHCHRNLTGIVVTGITSEEAFAGSPLRLRLGCENPAAAPRLELILEVDNQVTVLTRAPASDRFLIEVDVPTQQRGLLQVERCVLSTHFPLGLFRAWSWLHVPLRALVYAKPAGDQPAPQAQASDRGRLDSRQRGDEDFRGFKAYVPGDSPRHIAWKAVARGGPMLVKDLASSAHVPQLFALDDVRTGDLEARLSQLTQWIVDAERYSQSYGLRLPSLAVPPAGGAEHRRRCLAAIAMYGRETDATP